MTLFTDLLPDSKTEKHRGFKLWKFTPDPNCDFSHAVGTLLIESPGKRVEYLTSEFPVPTGRGFTLDKLGGAIGDHDATATGYECHVSREGRGVSCSCRGFQFGKGAACRHLAAVVSCVEQGWL